MPMQMADRRMFVVLDTDHFSELVRGSAAGSHLKDRIEPQEAQVFVTVITAQETLKAGLLLSIAKRRECRKLPPMVSFSKAWKHL